MAVGTVKMGRIGACPTGIRPPEAPPRPPDAAVEVVTIPPRIALRELGWLAQRGCADPTDPNSKFGSFGPKEEPQQR